MSRSPAVEGWFTTGPEPTLLGSRCTTCATVYFPPTPAERAGFCRNPACDGEEFETAVPTAEQVAAAEPAPRSSAGGGTAAPDVRRLRRI